MNTTDTAFLILESQGSRESPPINRRTLFDSSFSAHIFPTNSLPYLSLVANIGLCLFLFLVGLEIDSSVIKRNARLSATVALAGMALPFGLGAALSIPLYHQFIPDTVKFTDFMLFTG